MLTAILELPLDRQVTALLGYIQRMERTISARAVQTVPAAEKEKTAASCNVVAAPPATSPISTSASLDSQSAHKRRRVLHRSEHPENVGAAGAHHGSGTLDSKDSLTVKSIRTPRDSLPVRGMGKVVRAQVEAFVRFAVSFVDGRQSRRVKQCDLVTAYSAAHETDEGKEEVSARVNQFFRNCLVTMRAIKHAAKNNDVEYALAEIGRTRVHYAAESLERCMQLRPESSVFLQWCISLRDSIARDHT